MTGNKHDLIPCLPPQTVCFLSSSCLRGLHFRDETLAMLGTANISSDSLSIRLPLYIFGSAGFVAASTTALARLSSSLILSASSAHADSLQQGLCELRVPGGMLDQLHLQPRLFELGLWLPHVHARLLSLLKPVHAQQAERLQAQLQTGPTLTCQPSSRVRPEPQAPLEPLELSELTQARSVPSNFSLLFHHTQQTYNPNPRMF